MFFRRLGLAAVLTSLCLLGPAFADEPILLRYKMSKGDTLYYKNSMEMKQTQKIVGMERINQFTQDVIVSRKVEDVDGKGQATLKTKNERRKIKADIADLGKYEFDSTSTERDTSSALGGAVTPLFERLTGSTYDVHVSPRGEVVAVKGLTELVADVLKDNSLAAQFSGGLGSEAGAKNSEQDTFVVFSEKAVKPGDQWEAPFEFDIPQVGKMKGNIVFVYEGDDKVGDRKTVRISVTSDISLELNVDSGGAKVTGTISTSSSSGKVQFDPVAGRVLSSKRSLSMSGQLTVDAGGMIIPIDSAQDQTNTIELLDKLPE